jgi:cytochrome c oxidase subunit III
MKSSRVKEEPGHFLTQRREPLRFMLWVAIAGIIALFLVLTILYVLRRQAPGWSEVHLPLIFWLSTAIILFSSLTLRWADIAFREEKFKAYTNWIGITLLLGFGFVMSQLVGWWQMIQEGVLLQNNVSGAFVYLISGLHVAHILGGLFFLSLSFSQAVTRSNYVDAFIYSVNPPNRLRLRLISIYWHFVDVLWVYLFVFFLVVHR